MLARLAKTLRTAGRAQSRSFADWGNPRLDVKTGFTLPGSHGETDSLGANSETKFGRKSLVPPYNPYEFVPYKMEKDRHKFLSGYSYEEAYNIQKGSKTSKVVRANMLQDNVVIVVLLVLVGIMMAERSREHSEYQTAYKEYMDAQLSEQRDLVMAAPRNPASSETHN
jgi:hypothetical protein